MKSRERLSVFGLGDTARGVRESPGRTPYRKPLRPLAERPSVPLGGGAACHDGDARTRAGEEITGRASATIGLLSAATYKHPHLKRAEPVGRRIRAFQILLAAFILWAVYRTLAFARDAAAEVVAADRVAMLFFGRRLSPMRGPFHGTGNGAIVQAVTGPGDALPGPLDHGSQEVTPCLSYPKSHKPAMLIPAKPLVALSGRDSSRPPR
jgi:hypothetical protein